MAVADSPQGNLAERDGVSTGWPEVLASGFLHRGPDRMSGRCKLSGGPVRRATAFTDDTRAPPRKGRKNYSLQLCRKRKYAR